VLAVYSPELLASQEEYLRAQAAAERFRTSDLPDVRVSGETLLAAARERLRLFDVPERFIEELARTGKPQRAVTLVAPVSGYATSKDVFEGTRVEPGMPLFTVTDLASVWIEADVYEYEASAVRPGQEAAITLPYDPEVRLAGRVTYVYPTLDPESRTLKVRFEASNPRLVLRPGMYANVDLEVDFGEGVIVPADAILDTGTRQLVFVETGSGVFEPREIRVSGRSGDSARVLEGLREGERVAVHANFLLDSESRLRAAIAGMTRKREGGK
jgi:RND family efflux transporter MFP subunit